jgi:Mitochondrial carrier protein
MSSISAPSPTSIETHRITTTTTSSGNSSSNNTNKHSTKSGNDVTRRMICGGISGMIAKTVTNPLDRIKMLSQTGEYTSHGGSSGALTKNNSSGFIATMQNITNIYRSIIKNEGILGLWAGNGINLLRVFPNKAIIFSTNDIYTRYMQQWYFRNHHHGGIPNTSSTLSEATVLPPIYSFLAGGMAGMTATAVTYPLDLARGRIAGKVGVVAPSSVSSSTKANVATSSIVARDAAASAANPKVYNGMIQTILVTIKDEGFLGLYKGITPTLLGAMPYVGIQFGTVGLLEKYFDRNKGNHTNNHSVGQKKKHDPLQKMVFGGIGGIMAGIITYPNDTIRRMMQLQGSRGTVVQYKGYFHCLTSIVRQHGISRLYRGWTINMIRMAPNTAVIFGSYEFLKHITAQWSI